MNTIIEILIDNSNSMGNCKGIFENYKDYLLPDGSTRMELAKKILLSEIIPTIDYASNITVSLFHSLEYKEKPREIVQPILHEGKNDEQLKNAIKEIVIPHKTGGTPITDALLNCIDRLKIYPDSDRKIILITDGEETGKKDYKIATKNAIKLSGISCNIFIVGISLKAEARVKAESLVKETNGEYFHLETSNYNKATIQNKLIPLKSALIVDTVNKISTVKIEEPKKEVKNTITENTSTKKIIALEQNVSDNNKLLNLISKQVSLIQSGISKQNEEDDFDDENLIVKENSELNEKVGKASETYLFGLLKEKFGKRIQWMNENGESGNSYDFKVLDSIDDSIEYYIECKGTLGKEKVFYLTKNEWSLFLKNTSKYQIYFISDALQNPKVTKIDNLMNWILTEKVVPYPLRNRKQKAERIIFTITE
jgi:hypothetical protein